MERAPRAPPGHVTHSGCCPEHSANWLVIDGDGMVCGYYPTEEAATAALTKMEGGDNDNA